MNIEVTGRHVEMTDQLRSTTEATLSRLTRWDDSLTRIVAVITAEGNPRMAELAHRVEVACFGSHDTVRAHGTHESAGGAVDAAADHAEEQLRRAAERRASRAHDTVRTMPAL